MGSIDDGTERNRLAFVIHHSAFRIRHSSFFRRCIMMDSPLEQKTRVSRRDFVAIGAAAGTAITTGLAAVPAAGRVPGANDRIQFGVIGTGGMGSGHVSDLVSRADRDNVRCAAVCDVYQKRLDNNQKRSGGDAYTDYRKLLDRKDIDAVVIATPDHWHAKQAIDAMEAGKDVYLQKPMTLTIAQAIAVRDAAKRLKRKLQVGTQYTSEPEAWAARQAIAEGRIGKVVWSQNGYCRNSREGQFNWTIDTAAGPDATGENHIDWDMWLGHEWGLAPKIPFNADHFFRFRKYWAYNGGVATDLLYHALAPLVLAIAGPQGEYPRKVVSGGGQYIEKDGRDIPDSHFMLIEYPSEHTVLLASVMTNDVGIPRIIRGQYGTIEFGGGLKLRGQPTWKDEFSAKNAGQMDATVAAPPRRDHVGNFIDAVRGQAELACNEDLGCALMVAIRLGEDAYRQNKTMLWDASKEEAAAV
ncbi:MAG: Gfo/Idh/MocA family oxidoreductase [Planctomycetia bacterium]|nr:Gfo/Idh/MocA family oxidoreductase [Planctomycetia bacterium]